MKKSVLILSALSLAASSCLPPVYHEGDSVGQEIQNDNITLYVTGEPSETAVLYLTDVHGIQFQFNRLLADSFANAGYLTVAPDLFNGTPAASDLDAPTYNLTEFLDTYNPEVIDPMIASAVKYLRGIEGVKHVVATGYCFGGRYAFRTLSEGKDVDAAFAAHPSMLDTAEVQAITRPISVAVAENDGSLAPERVAEIEELLGTTNQPYSLTVFSGTGHGFAVRGNVSDPEQKYGKEQAFYQALSWFEAWH